MTINPTGNLNFQSSNYYINESGKLVVADVSTPKLSYVGDITIDAQGEGATTVAITNSDPSQVANLSVEGDIAVNGGTINLATGETIDAKTAEVITITTDGNVAFVLGDVSGAKKVYVYDSTGTNDVFSIDSDGNIVADGNVTIAGSFTAASTTFSSLTVSGTATITGLLTANGGLSVTGNSSVSGNSTVGGNSSVSGTSTVGTLAPGITNTVIAHSNGVLQTRTIDGKVWNGALVDYLASTTGYLPMYSNSLGTLTNSSIFETGGKVGIGTTVPGAYKLNVNGNTNITGNLLVTGDIDSATGTITTLDGTTLTYTTGNVTTANVTTLDLGTNTMYDGNLTGNWAFNGGNLSGIGTIGSGAITSTGAVQGTSFTDGTATLTSGALSGLTGIISSGTIQFSSLTTNGALYTSGGNGTLTTTAPTSGAIGYFTRTGTNLLPTTAGDDVYLGTNELLGVGYDPSTIVGGVAAFSGNVGIGDITPSSKLEVTGDIRISTGSGGQIIFADGSTMSSSGLGSAAALSNISDAIVTGDSDASGAGDVIFKTGSNDRLHILNNGNVGIGTTSPTSMLSVGASSQFQVSSTGAITSVGLNSGSGLIQGTGGLTITGAISLPNSSITNIMLANSTISGISLGSNLATLTFGTHLTGTSYNGSTGVTIATDATEANTISTIVARDASGNFSAGTITASLTGHASLDLPLTGGTLSGNLALGANNLTMSGSLSDTTNRVTKGWFTNVESTNMYTVGGTSLSSTFAPIAGTMYIGTTAHALNRASAAEGLAGITSLTPGANFTLNQNSVNVLTSENTGAIVNTLYLKLGNVGIGTTGPAMNLDINSTSGATDLLRLKTTSTTRSTITFSPSGNSWEIGARGSAGNPNNAFYLFDQAAIAYRMVVDSAGNVGIGTTAPGALLHVYRNNGSYPNLIVENAGGHSILDIKNNTSGEQGIRFYYGATQQAEIFNNANEQKLQFWTPGGTKMVIQADGNVGIGTTNPSVQLDIEAANPQVDIQSSGAGYGTLKLGNSGASFYIAQENSSGGSNLAGSAAYAGIINQANPYPLQFGTSNAVRMTILSGGNVGIGTTSPIQKLDIGSGYAYLRDSNAIVFLGADSTFIGRAGSANYHLTGSAIGDLAIKVNSGQKLMLGIDTTPSITISAGNVGIGTTGPEAPLSVSGLISISPTGGDYNEGIRIHPSSSGDYSTIALGAVAGVTGSGVGQWNFLRYPAASSYLFGIRYNGTDFLNITNAGNVGIGTVSPFSGYKLTVNGDAKATRLSAGDQVNSSTFGGNTAPTGAKPVLEVRTQQSTGWPAVTFHYENILTSYLSMSDSPRQFRMESSPSEATTGLYVQGNVGINDVTPDYKLDVNGTIRGFGITDSSDTRLKKNVTNLEGSLSKLLQLKGVSYNWIDENAYGANKQLGFIAQDVEPLFPELVSTDSDGYKSIAYGKMTAVIVGSIQEQQLQIADNTSKLSAISNVLQPDGSDVAEIYPTTETGIVSGEIVSLSVGDSNSSTVIRSGMASDPNLLGVVTTKPALLLGSNIESGVAVALIGRVPVKVNDQNGVIAKGDYVTSSSAPGVGMKATQAGMVVGRALENVTCKDTSNKQQETNNGGQDTNNQETNEEQDTSDNGQEINSLSLGVSDLEIGASVTSDCTVSVFMNVSWFDPNHEALALSTTPIDTSNITDLTLQTLSVLGDSTFVNATVTGNLNVGLLSIADSSLNVAGGVLKLQDAYGSGNIEAFGGKIVMTTEGSIQLMGDVVARSVQTEKLTIDTANVAAASAGMVVIKAGTKEMDIETSALTSESLVFITTQDSAVPFTYRMTGINKITIYTPVNVDIDTTVNWWIIN